MQDDEARPGPALSHVDRELPSLTPLPMGVVEALGAAAISVPLFPFVEGGHVEVQEQAFAANLSTGPTGRSRGS